jgi:hypothetical protein
MYLSIDIYLYIYRREEAVYRYIYMYIYRREEAAGRRAEGVVQRMMRRYSVYLLYWS